VSYSMKQWYQWIDDENVINIKSVEYAEITYTHQQTANKMTH